MKTFNRSDIEYKHGFPANIDHGKPVVVQVTPNTQSIILYTCSVTGNSTRCYLSESIGNIFNEGIYIFNPSQELSYNDAIIKVLKLARNINDYGIILTGLKRPDDIELIDKVVDKIVILQDQLNKIDLIDSRIDEIINDSIDKDLK